MNSVMMGFLKEASDLSLKQHQQRVADKLKRSNTLLVYHGMGSGKTYSALNAAQKLNMPLKVVGPASLRNTFSKEKRKHHVKANVSSYTYNKPPETVSNKDLLVFDEAHRMGQLTSQRSHLVDKLRGGKSMFLTGTPIRNAPSELIPLMRGLGVKTPRDVREFNARYIKLENEKPGLINGLIRLVTGTRAPMVQRAQHLDELKRLLRGKVDYYKPSVEGFPKVHEKNIQVDMTEPQEEVYRMALRKYPDLAYKAKKGLFPNRKDSGRMNAFLTLTRQISNIPTGFNSNLSIMDAPKITRAYHEITKRYKSDPNYKGVTYSNYLGHGVDPIAFLLARAKIPYGRFTGDLSIKEKNKMIKDYNSGRIKHLLISGAGGEGLDLKGTKLLQVMESAWNEPQLDQVKARAIRFKSHEHLPKKERKVEIQNYIARPREHGIFFKKRDQGTDEYLKMISKRKTELNNQFLGALQEVGSE